VPKVALPKVNPDLQTFLPAANDDLLAALRAKIEKEGPVDPVKVAEDGDIVDGYSRFIIYAEMKIKKFPVVVVTGLDTLVKKKEWMRDHQLARRNLTAAEWAYFYGLKFNEQKKDEGRPKLPQNDGVNETGKQGETAVRLAEQSGKSQASIERAGQFAEAVDAAPAAVRPALIGGVVPIAAAVAAHKEDAPLFCPRCTRVGPVKGCAKCALVQLAFRKKKAKAAPKKGAVLVDWLGWEKAVGVVVRLSDRICDAYPGEKHGHHQAEYEKAVARVVQLGKDWKKRLTAGGV
jgi:hypothetical protein